MKMLIKIAHVLLFSAFLFFAASNVHSQTGTAESFSSTIIKGFAQWNASRIENIVLSNGLKQAADVGVMVISGVRGDRRMAYPVD